MDNNEKIERINYLVGYLNMHSFNYYVLDNPVIADKEYDKNYDELLNLEKETGYISKNSPTQRIGDVILSKFEKYTHRAKLWSLDKAQLPKDIVSWHNRNVKFIEEYNRTHKDKLPKIKYVITKKFDGLTINCTYNEDGTFGDGATRGNGETGEHVSEQIKTIINVPHKIDNTFSVDVHGEALMTKKAFENYNNNLKKGDSPLKNLRNGAAGALRNLDTKETSRRKLIAYFYDISYSEKEFSSYIETLNWMKEKGIPVDDYMKECYSVEDIEREYKYIESIRSSLPYDIDGIVIAIDDFRTREALGYTIKFPKWAIAYKFEALEATSKVIDVEWNVSRAGKLCPTALLEPVDIGGITVKRATLNNMGDIKKKGVKIGLIVHLRRSNDVIPEITGVASKSEDAIVEIVPPAVCPECGAEVIKDGAHYFCINSMTCKPQLVKSIVHFASRQAMNIEGFNDKTSEMLFEKLNIKSIPDLYKIKKNDLIGLPGFAEKKAQKLVAAIEKSKTCHLNTFLYALGIPGIGEKTAKDIANKFKSLENIETATYDDLISIRDVGKETANNIISYFASEDIIKTIKELVSLGIDISYKESHQFEDSAFTGKTVVVTGTLKDYTRNGIKEKLESLGAKVTGSVSKKTDYVLAGEEAGGKYDTAVELGVKILTEEDFKNMIK